MLGINYPYNIRHSECSDNNRAFPKHLEVIYSFPQAHFFGHNRAFTAVQMNYDVLRHHFPLIAPQRWPMTAPPFHGCPSSHNRTGTRYSARTNAA